MSFDLPDGKLCVVRLQDQSGRVGIFSSQNTGLRRQFAGEFDAQRRAGERRGGAEQISRAPRPRPPHSWRAAVTLASFVLIKHRCVSIAERECNGGDFGIAEFAGLENDEVEQEQTYAFKVIG